MQVGTLAVQLLFEKDVLYRVPLYQRPYVWGEEEQWRPLWEDVQRLAELLIAGQTPRAHFLGATVQDREIVPPGQIESKLIIDGQQRLTTLQLLLKAFHDVAGARGEERYASAIAKLVRNDHPLSTKPHERFKVWPTNADRTDYDRVMHCNSPAELAKACGARADARAVGRSMIDGYLYFSRAVAAWIDEEPEAATRIAALYSAIRDNVRLVVIDLDEKDDAQLIFETLNARGTPLLAADLVKNMLLGLVQRSGGNGELAYQAHWQSFDYDSGFWRAESGRGHAQRARLETFLQHALTVFIGKEVSAAHLYAAYRDYAASPDAPPPVEQMKALHRFGSIYRKLIDGYEQPRIRLFLERVRIMDLETIFPFLIKLVDRLDDDAAALIPVLVDIESFLVRRLVARLSTRSFGRLFVDLLAPLDAHPSEIGAAVRAKLMAGTAEVDRWPADAEFRQAWTTYALYENLTRPRLRMLLEGLEAGLRNDLAESRHVPRNLTVEHVLPQSWTQHWPLPLGVDPTDASERRDRVVHTIGNLTLLNERMNPLQSNRPWLTDPTVGPGKREGLQENCTLFLNKALVKYDEWDEGAIAERADILFETARNIWPHPM